MAEIILKNKTLQGDPLEVKFLPDKGMNMLSYKKGSLEVIDQSTISLFDERFAGLGPLIGPHFHHRNPQTIPLIKDEALFPHIARIHAKGIQEPFSHGIARYAPWTNVQASETKIKARLTGKDSWNGIPLAQLEGQNFTYDFSAELKSDGLWLNLSIVSDADSLVGIHYYWHLPEGQGKVISRVQNRYHGESGWQPIPTNWSYNEQQFITFDLTEAADYTFFPFPNPLEGKIALYTKEYSLALSYDCRSQENSWQLYHPKGASFVCIEPLSAQDPRHPNLTVSSLSIHIEIKEAWNER
jgi:hypothetical protein